MTTSAIPEAHRDSVHAIAHRYGVAGRDVFVAPRQGQVNLTIFLGNDLVLRLPRKPKFEQRLAKEAEVIPFVLERGIPTAKLVAFDSGRGIADVTYMVLERLHGRTIDDLPSPADDGSRTFGSLFEILSVLHSLRREDEARIGGVETAEFSYELLLHELTTEGEIGGHQAAWLQQWFRDLEAHGARCSAPVLLHGDVMPSNLILDDSGEVTAIIDWGSACWAEAARDLASFRTFYLPGIVDSYRRVEGVPADVSLEASVLWYQLFFALAKLLGRTSTSEKRNWSAPRGARLLELMRFISTDVPDRWRALLREHCA